MFNTIVGLTGKKINDQILNWKLFEVPFSTIYDVDGN